MQRGLVWGKDLQTTGVKAKRTKVYTCKISQNPWLSALIDPRHSNSTVLQYNLFLNQYNKKPRQDLVFNLLHLYQLHSIKRTEMKRKIRPAHIVE